MIEVKTAITNEGIESFEKDSLRLLKDFFDRERLKGVYEGYDVEEGNADEDWAKWPISIDKEPYEEGTTLYTVTARTVPIKNGKDIKWFPNHDDSQWGIALYNFMEKYPPTPKKKGNKDG